MPSTTCTKYGSMWKITSACVMIATITTPNNVPKTLTCPPLSAAPPMTGAAKERISQSSPIEGWPSCSRATSMMPGERRQQAGNRMRPDCRARDRDAGEFGRVARCRRRRGCSARSAGGRADSHMPATTSAAGSSEPRDRARNRGVAERLHARRNAVERLRARDAEIGALEDRQAGERDDEGGNARARDQTAVDEPARRRRSRARESGECRRKAPDLHQRRQSRSRQAADRADRQVHLADRDDDHLRHRDHAIDRRGRAAGSGC